MRSSGLQSGFVGISDAKGARVMKRLQLLALYFWLKIQASEWRRARRGITDYCVHRKTAKCNAVEVKLNPRPFTKDEKDFTLLVVLIVGLWFLQSLTKSSRNQSSRGAVPPSAERLLSSLILGEHGECLIGDLQEEYEVLEEEIGSVRAKIWVYRQVFKSVWPLAREAARAMLSYWLGQITH